MNIQGLAKAVDEGDALAVEAALAAGVAVNERLRSGGTVLMRAASGGRLAVLQAVLRGGADVDAKRDDGITALMLASFFGHEDAVAALLAGGADVTAEDIHKFTAVRLASARLHTGVIRMLEQAESESRPPAGSALRSSERPQSQEESPRPARAQEEKERGAVIASPRVSTTAAPAVVVARRPEPCAEENAPPPESDAPPPEQVGSSRPVGGVRLLAVGACAVVILFAGVERTLSRRTKEPAAGSVPPVAVEVGAQPVAPPAPPSAQERPAVVEPATAETPVPPRPDHTAESNGRSTPPVVGRIEPHTVPAPQQHAAEPAVVSMSEHTPPPTRPQTQPRPAEVKEPSPSPPTATTREVIVVTTPHGTPQGKARQVEPPPVVAPPVSSSAQKRKVIPWP